MKFTKSSLIALVFAPGKSPPVSDPITLFYASDIGPCRALLFAPPVWLFRTTWRVSKRAFRYSKSHLRGMNYFFTELLFISFHLLFSRDASVSALAAERIGQRPGWSIWDQLEHSWC